MMPESYIERFNQAVRGIVTLGLTAAFIWLALGEKISGDVFTSVFAGIIGYWFASRDARMRASDQPTMTTTKGDTTVVAGPTPTPAGG